MAVIVTIEVPGGTQEMYDAIDAKIQIPSEWIPDGLIAHTAGPVDGGWRVIDVWRSAEDFESAIPPKLAPLMGEYAAESGVELAEPKITITPLYNVFARESEPVLA